MSSSILHQQTKAAVDAAAKEAGFRCVPVSWEDATRGKSAGGSLSCVGPNIADVRLYEKSGTLLYTLRSQNWNERLGYVAAADVALVTGNESANASAQQSTTLAAYLQGVGSTAKYAGIEVPSLYEPTIDNVFSIRFQTVFLPVADAARGGASAPTPPSTEFCTEVYSYQTRSAEDPRNMLLLATPQGVSVQQDVQGRGKVFFHSVDGAGTVHRYWLEAEKSEKQVGGAQVESREEALEAAKRGKATAVRIGPSSMGTRFNVQMLIQVPLKQRPPAPSRRRVSYGGLKCLSSSKKSSCSAAPAAGAACLELDEDDSDDALLDCLEAKQQSQSKLMERSRRSTCVSAVRTPVVGTSNAARVSRGSEQDTWAGVANKRPQRDASQHGTITVTMYYTVVGGVPSAVDVKRACADLDALYKQCPSDKRLVKCDEVTSTGGVVGGGAATTTTSVPKTLPHAAGLTQATCPGGHTLAACFGGEVDELPNGWWCDGCGVHVPKGPSPSNAGTPKGFSCRGCDFDICAHCASGPLCPQKHPLVRLAPPSASCSTEDTATCRTCKRTFAAMSATFWGCGCTASYTAQCNECYCRLAIANSQRQVKKW